MHKANETFWQFVNFTYKGFLDENILEVGSFDINGSVRNICASTSKEYIGVDWRAGPKVDVVCLAHDMVFDSKFKAVLSASMLEHDPHYEKSLPTMCGLVRSDGMLALSWGSARNPMHCREEAPDGEFHKLPVNKVLTILEAYGFHLQVLVYDANLHKLPNVSYRCPAGSGLGEINLIAFPHPTKTIWIDDLLSEDNV